jgi:hypothetical protein
VRWVLHGHGLVPFSGNRHNQRPPRRRQSGKSPASWPGQLRPKNLSSGLERMQFEPRQIHMGNVWGGVKRRHNIPQPVDMLRVHAAVVVLFKKAVSGPCGGLSLLSRTVTRHVAHVKHDTSKTVGFFVGPVGSPGRRSISNPSRKELEALAGRRVDLVTRRGLKPWVRPAVLKAARVIYAA